MPYFIFVVTSNESNRKSATLVTAYENFREAKNEVKRLRKEQPLEQNQIYKINFSPTEAQAEKELTEYREEPIAKEWEK
ncbi:MAG: hypothetical protein OEY45_06115 [Gammaproteobacteria bacterium]|jgi:hypothetical protein|nr:hypothetical protein [Gammaproteobacteria bacterium]MDH5514717.1 hypothetical protein [Gammaproteobacteria bacterium]HSG11515.1 hypothetical protein [Gammaproteobacteria bacterium]